MQNIRLGNSPLHTSRLAYGCWRIARDGDEAVDFATARAAVFAAFDVGCTLFDHADIYCDGRAEAVFGRLLRENRGLRNSILIATKCGIRPGQYDFSADYIIGQCDQSLRRLNVDSIDLFQLHRPDYLMRAEEVAAALEHLHRAGKVREFGVSNFKPSQVSLLQSLFGHPLLVNQIEISLVQQSALEDGTLDQCQERHITPLAWSPLGGGLLGGGAPSLLPHQQKYDATAVNAALEEVAAQRGVSREVIAFAWLLRHPAGIVPLIGSTQPARIHEAARALGVELTRAEWYRLLVAARGEPLA